MKGKKRKTNLGKASIEGLARYLNGRLAKWLGGKLPGQKEVQENLQILYLGMNTEERTRNYYVEKTVLLLKVLAAGGCAAILSGIASQKEGILTDGHFLTRQEAAYTRELQIDAAGEENWSVEVLVEPQKLTQKESRELLENISEKLDSYILGDNHSLEEVRNDLKLSRQIEGTPVQVEWELDSYEVLNLDGSLRRENLKEEGSLVELTAHLRCYEEEAVCRICAKVLPPVPGKEEQFLQELSEAIEALRKETEEEAAQELPVQVQGKALTWKEKRPLTCVGVLFLTWMGMVVLYAAKDRELKQRITEREEQMCRDYVRIVGKLNLLMGAGATVRCAWEMMAADYQTRQKEGQEERRYAYEEMALACREMQNGVAEAKAYENFGLRCRIPAYLKLSALLEQNLKKGNKGLTELLRAEAEEAKAWRRELARRKGEEASTRLLLPMILMLVVVMLLILVPAGMSMQT